MKPSSVSTFIWAVVLTIGGAHLARAQDEPVFHSVFEFLTGSEAPLPILKKFAATAAGDDTFDGTSTMDSFGGFERYDASRLLLGIRENGINESDPAHDAAMAAQYPDRSLIWIDDRTGAPLGIALVVGAAPAALDQEFLDSEGTVEDYYFNFGASDDGVAFVGYKNLILRYAPDGQGGFGEPTVTYRHENDGSERWYQWRWETFRVRGEGTDTLLIAGGKTWRPQQQTYIFATHDGVEFEQTGFADYRGGNSHIIPAGFDDASPTEEWIFGSVYPGSDSGLGTGIRRGFRDAEFDDTFGFEPFPAEPDPDGDYTPQFVSDADAHPDFPFVVSYSTPSWNTEAVLGGEFRPGWIAVHDFEGFFVHAHQLEITEEAEFVTDPDYRSAQWHGTLGKVEVNVLPGMEPGTAEILWYSGIYGYGRYLFGTNEEPERVTPNSLPFQMTVVERIANNIQLTWPSRAGQSFTIENSGNLTDWLEVADGVPSGGDTTTYTVEDAPDADQYYRARRE
jgi:hypothetical protein